MGDVRQALRNLMDAYERRIRSDCTPEQLKQEPWRCAEYVAAESFVSETGDSLALAQLATALRWCVKHDGECLGDHPDMLTQARAALNGASEAAALQTANPDWNEQYRHGWNAAIAALHSNLKNAAPQESLTRPGIVGAGPAVAAPDQQSDKNERIASKELFRLAYVLGNMVNQYGQPDWSLDEFLEGLSDISEQLTALARALPSAVVASPQGHDEAKKRIVECVREIEMIADAFGYDPCEWLVGEEESARSHVAPKEIIDPPGAAVEMFRRRYGRLPNRVGDQLPLSDRLELAAQACHAAHLLSCEATCREAAGIVSAIAPRDDRTCLCLSFPNQCPVHRPERTTP